MSSYFLTAIHSLAVGRRISVHITEPDRRRRRQRRAVWTTSITAGTAAAGVISLGTAASYSVLGLANTQINNGPATITGNEGISAGGKLTNQAPSTITGNVYESAAGEYSGPGTLDGSVITNASLLTQNDTDAQTASTVAAGLTATQTFAAINAATTITGNGGLNVIDITGGINLNNASLTLSGTASDVFIVNVTGNATFAGTGGLLLAGGVTPNHVLYNFETAPAPLAPVLALVRPRPAPAGTFTSTAAEHVLRDAAGDQLQLQFGRRIHRRASSAAARRSPFSANATVNAEHRQVAVFSNTATVIATRRHRQVGRDRLGGHRYQSAAQCRRSTTAISAPTPGGTAPTG